VLFACALIGIVITLAANQDPGDLLGFFIIVGSVGAVLGIRRGRIYLVFPVPALTFFFAAIVVGKIHDAKFGSSTAAVAGGFTQWIAGIFFPAVVATILVLLIGGGRWVLGRTVVAGQSLLAPGSPAPRGPRPPQAPRRPAPSARRPARDDDDPARDSWADESPFGEEQALRTEMMPAVGPDGRPKPDGRPRPGRPDLMNGTGGQRPPRDQQRPSRGQPRADRDQWGDPRSQPPGTGPRPRQSGTQPRSPQSGAQPRTPQSGAQPRAPRPPYNPNQRPPRPARPNPPEGWNPR
jgi:hypothetical protein